MTTQETTEVRLLPHSRLKVDHAYQRDLDEAWMRHIYAEFQEGLLGLLVVSVRDNGEEVVLDGQHRLAAIRYLTEDEPAKAPKSVWCECYFGLTPQREAEIFIGRNSQKSVHPIQLHRARCAAGEPLAKEIDQILRDHGTSIGFQRRHSYACIDVLYKAHHYGCLDDVIEIIEASWAREGAVQAYAARTEIVVQGTLLFHISAFGTTGYSTEEAIRRFRQRIRIVSLTRQAREAAYATRTGISYQVAEILRTQAYNFQRGAAGRIAEIVTRQPRKGL